MQLKIKRLTDTAKLPAKAHKTDAGFDIFADEDLLISVGQTVTVSTGIALSIQEGFYGRLKGRSGLTAKTALRVQEGTIDSDYRGEIKVICDLRETSKHKEDEDILIMTQDYQINKGDRIAQLIIQALPPVDLVEVDKLNDSERATGGFGSTGMR